MIKKKINKDGTVRVTFSVDDSRPVSVVGDFNDWDPMANPLIRRSNGLRSAAINLPADALVRFRYLADGGDFYDDPHADSIESNEMGGTHCVVSAAIDSSSSDT